MIKSYEAGKKHPSTVGDVYFRDADHQLRPAGDHRQGQEAHDMKNKEDY